MAALTRLHKALRIFRSNLLIQVLFLVLFKNLLLRTNNDDFGVVEFHLGKELATTRASNYILKHRSLHSHNGSDRFQPRLKAIRAMNILQYSSTAMLLILLSGDVSPNPGWINSSLQKPGLKIGHLNIRSLPKHLDELRIFLQENPFDVFCLNETWLNSSWRDGELIVEGYNLVRKDRQDDQCGGGTAIYYKSNLVARLRTDIYSIDVEALWLEFTFPNKSKILVSSVYRPPNVEVKDFISKFESLLDYSCSEEKETLIFGDLNCDLAAKKLSADTKELCMLFKVYQFIQLIKEPTRIVERSSTLLDLAFTTDQGKISDSGVLECSISDHSLVYIIRKARPPRGPIKTIKCRSYKNYSTPNFVRDLHSASWDLINTSLTVDEAWTTFKDTFITIADRHAPTRTRRVRSNTLPWMTDHIRSLITQRNFRHKKAQRLDHPMIGKNIDHSETG